MTANFSDLGSFVKAFISARICSEINISFICQSVYTLRPFAEIIVQQHYEAMARRRFQDPRPKRRGKWWTIQVRRDQFVGGQLQRKKTRVRIAPQLCRNGKRAKLQPRIRLPATSVTESEGAAARILGEKIPS
jgi:hypothetical protein